MWNVVNKYSSINTVDFQLCPEIYLCAVLIVMSLHFVQTSLVVTLKMCVRDCHFSNTAHKRQPCRFCLRVE